MKVSISLWGLAAVAGMTATIAVAQSGDRPGFVQFNTESETARWRGLAPATDNPLVNDIVQSLDTMWYDKAAMQPAYQDSVTPVIGVRFNRIGRELAVDGELVFGTDQTFHFPFGHTAGTDQSQNFEVITFWAPPKAGDQAMPVVWYKDNTTRWRWLFPEGTIFGELMLVKDGQGNLYPFELRTRTRYADGWDVDLFRPYLNAMELSDAIKQARPDWSERRNLAAIVAHLEDQTTLRARRIASPYYGEAFEAIEGAVDSLPDFGDDQLVRELLTQAVFRSTAGEIWKESGNLETYGPTTDAPFSIVPQNYLGGLFPVNEVTCNECHQDTGRQIGEFSFNSVLYGEIWGEDRIFSWHLFDDSARLDAAFDRNRRMNPRLTATGLVTPYDPRLHTEPTYKSLPRRFPIIWR